MIANNSLRTIFRLAGRQLRRRPFQSIFFIIGVAIGVAMIVAIDLANGSAQRAFELAAETVTGRATHQIIGGPSRLDQTLYTQIRRDLGFRMSAPVVQDYVIAEELDAQPMQVLGVDVFSESPFRSYLGSGEENNNPRPNYLADWMARPNTVLLGVNVAERYGLTTGDTITTKVGSRTQPLTIVGLLEPSDDLSRRALDGLLLTDIATAQEIFDRIDRLDRIDLILPKGDAAAPILEEISAILPPSAWIEPSAASQGTVNEMTAAFNLNLTALSLLALLVGMFLIYNTVTFSVVQRRAVIGSLRALGMTRREIFGIILLEAALLGLIGTLIGLGLGILLGRGTVQLVTQTINDLFFVVTVREMDIPLFTLLKGLVVGICAAILAALVPAYEATSVAPAGALQRSNVEARTRELLPWISSGAVIVLIIGTLLLIPNWHLLFAFAGLFGIILGSALLAPLFTLGLMQAVQQLMNRFGGVIERMAPRYIIRSLSRTSVAIAALMVAISVIIGVGIMIGSFRLTVVEWLDEILQADIFISPPTMQGNQVLNTLDASLVEELATFPGVTNIATTRGVDVAAFLDTALDEASPDNPIIENVTTLRLAVLDQDIAGEKRRYRNSVGDWQATWEAAEAGGIILNDPMAYRYKLDVGDEIRLQTDQGIQTFPIVGVAVSFDANPGVLLADTVYRRLWDDKALSAIALFIDPALDLEDTVADIRASLAGKNELLVRSNRSTRQNAIEIFDRTFSITIALQMLATLVAFIGILSTLMSLQLERQREIGVLRSTGMTRRQLWRLSLWETGLIGTAAGLFAIPTGFALAIVLIYIINLRSFGWTLQMTLRPSEFIQALVVAIIAALLAGLYPAWRMGRMAPADGLRSE